MHYAVPLALTLLVTAGCTESLESFQRVYDPCAPLVLIPTGEMTSDERASIDDAISMWSDVASVQLTAGPATDEGRLLPVEMIDTKLYMGAFDDVNGRIRLARRVDQRHARAVVLAHELGHAFNLFHVPASRYASVMNKGNWKTEPTAGDASALERKWGPCVAR